METFKFPMSQLLDKPEQPKLLPGRRSIIQIAERPPLQQSQNINQSKTRLKVSIPENSIIPNGQDIMIRSFQYPITPYHKQCQNVIQFLEQ